MAFEGYLLVSNITNLSDARYAAGMGAQAISVQTIDSHGRYLSPAQYQEIRGWIQGPEVFADIRGNQLEDLNPVILNYQPDGFIAREADLALIPKHYPVILETKLIPPQVDHQIRFYIGSERTSNVPVLWEVRDAEQLQHLLQQGATSFVFESGSEEKPGIRNFADLSELFEVLENYN